MNYTHVNKKKDFDTLVTPRKVPLPDKKTLENEALVNQIIEDSSKYIQEITDKLDSFAIRKKEIEQELSQKDVQIRDHKQKIAQLEKKLALASKKLDVKEISEQGLKLEIQEFKKRIEQLRIDESEMLCPISLSRQTLFF